MWAVIRYGEYWDPAVTMCVTFPMTVDVVDVVTFSMAVVWYVVVNRILTLIHRVMFPPTGK